MNTDCYWHTQKICETSTIYITIRNELAVKLVLQRVSCKKYICPYNHMLAAVKTSFFCPKNVGFLNSKLEWVTDANQTTNWLQPKAKQDKNARCWEDTYQNWQTIVLHFD